MSFDLDVRRGIQAPQILHLPPSVASLGAAQEAIEWAESCGITLDESQCISLRAGMGERADWKWAAFEVVDIGPRQSTGKNETVAAREGYEMFIAGSKLAIHTAHEAKTADESFRRMEEMICNNSEMRAQVARFRYGNGDHAVEFKPLEGEEQGARLLYKTRTGGGARGFAGASLLVYDEALYLAAKHVTASLAVLARGKTAAHNPQVWSMSSAALATSDYMHDARRRAFRGNGGQMVIDGPGAGGRLAYIEHTAEVLTLDDKRILSNRGLIDLDDRRFWAIANPAMNHPEHGIAEEFIEAEKRFQSSDPEGWARERLGFFDPAPEDTVAKDVKLNPDRWALTGITREQALIADFARPLGAAFDVDQGGASASISVGAGSLVAPYVENIEHRTGTGWLPDTVVALLLAHPDLIIGCNGKGPAGDKVGAVLFAMSEAKIPADRLKQFGTDEYKQACGAFYTDVNELSETGRPRLQRPAQGQGPLCNAAADAAERLIGDGWAWDLRNVTVPISPLVSCTIARALLPMTAPAEFFMY